MFEDLNYAIKKCDTMENVYQLFHPHSIMKDELLNYIKVYN